MDITPAPIVAPILTVEGGGSIHQDTSEDTATAVTAPAPILVAIIIETVTIHDAIDTIDGKRRGKDGKNHNRPLARIS